MIEKNSWSSLISPDSETGSGVQRCPLSPSLYVVSFTNKIRVYSRCFSSTVPLCFLPHAPSFITSVYQDKYSIFKCFKQPFSLRSDQIRSDQIKSVAQSCPTLCDPMNRSTTGLPVHHQLPEFTQTHVHRVSDAIQPSHPLSSPSPLAPNPSQHQSLFQ